MLKKLFLVGLMAAFVAVPATANLQCTITCLAENQSCDEGPTVCALIFEICIELCEDPPIGLEWQPTSTEEPVPELFPVEPWFARPGAAQVCAVEDH